MEREKSLFKNTVVLMLGLILPRAVSIINVAFITRSIPKDAFGQYEYMYNIVQNLFIPIITLQLSEGIFRFLIDAKEEETPYYVSTGFGYMLIALLITIIVFCIFSFDGFEGKYRFLIALFAGVELIGIYSRPIVRGLGMNKIYSLTGIYTSIINIVCCYLFIIVFDMKIIGLILAVIVADSFANIYQHVKSKAYQHFRPAFINKEVFLKLFKYSVTLLPNLIAWYVISLSDRVIIKNILDYDAVGIYGVANKIPTILSVVYMGFNMAWTESAARSINDQDVNKYYSKMTFNLTRVLSAGLVGLIAFSPIVFKVIVRGENYDVAYQYVALMLVSTFLSCISNHYGSLYIARKETKGISISSIIGAVVNIVVHFALIKYIGLYAAVISTLVAYIIIVVYRVIDIQKNHFKLKYYNRLNLICLIGIVIAVVLYKFGETNMYILIGNMVYSLVFAYVTCGDLFVSGCKMVLSKIKI